MHLIPVKKLFASLKKYFSKEYLNIISMLSFYRVLTLVTTSTFYFISPVPGSLFLKTLIVTCLIVEAFLFIKIFNKENNKYTKYILLIFESVGLMTLLIFTGGINSPFLWYSLNPILISIFLEPFYFCWIILAFFTVPLFLFNKFSLNLKLGYESNLPDGLFFLLVFMLIVFAAQIYSFLIKKLSKQAAELKEYVSDLNELYEATGTLTGSRDLQFNINIFAEYIKKMTGAEKVILSVKVAFKRNQAGDCRYFAIKGQKNWPDEDVWLQELSKVFADMEKNNLKNLWISELKTNKKVWEMVTTKISSNTKVYGVILAFLEKKYLLNDKTIPTLQFLAKLCAQSIEKYGLELIEEEVIIREEQDRLAGEIHDSVSQDLFSLVCGLEILKKNNRLDTSMQKHVRAIQDTARRSITELRHSIYDLSCAKKKNGSLKYEIKKYLNDASKLNDVKIGFVCRGDFNLLGISKCKGIYRIIREATGNAIKHSGCSKINVSINIDDVKIKLRITDNGKGFDLNDTFSKKYNGFGLINMKELANAMNGYIKFTSNPDKGTVVFCEVPLNILALPQNKIKKSLCI